VAVRDGAVRLLYAPARQTRMAVSGLLATDDATITVAGIGLDGIAGPSGRAALRARG
jgi:hypothetical protein